MEETNTIWNEEWKNTNTFWNEEWKNTNTIWNEEWKKPILSGMKNGRNQYYLE